MHRAQEQVRDFMRAAGQPTPARPVVVLSRERMTLRLELIREEFEELQAASEYRARITPEVVDALCDLLYVTYGFAVEAGVDIEPFYELVHEANMRKMSGPVREDGKKLKPPGWTPPDIEGLLSALRTQRP